MRLNWTSPLAKNNYILCCRHFVWRRRSFFMFSTHYSHSSSRRTGQDHPSSLLIPLKKLRRRNSRLIRSCFKRRIQVMISVVFKRSMLLWVYLLIWIPITINSSRRRTTCTDLRRVWLIILKSIAKIGPDACLSLISSLSSRRSSIFL